MLRVMAKISALLAFSMACALLEAYAVRQELVVYGMRW